MKNEYFYKYNAGKYRLIKFVIRGNDCSEKYANGCKNKSMYMFSDITYDGQFSLKVHSGGADKEYKYFLDTEEKKYHLKADYSDEGIPIMIENGVLTGNNRSPALRSTNLQTNWINHSVNSIENGKE